METLRKLFHKGYLYLAEMFFKAIHYPPTNIAIVLDSRMKWTFFACGYLTPFHHFPKSLHYLFDNSKKQLKKQLPINNQQT